MKPTKTEPEGSLFALELIFKDRPTEEQRERAEKIMDRATNELREVLTDSSITTSARAAR